ncbi:hypothetical protein BDN71DRAFT_1430183 [Pleurotus eryngii]|uniref:Uncharacterized protein n=1 Tax=Pleurotus eryngii TaxID=5323 RepID=A0A9P5ZZ22_PLEER|nr:hypothetical protein BDN71DRAFT_1430183 [Pleurotus eryngii]
MALRNPPLPLPLSVPPANTGVSAVSMEMLTSAIALGMGKVFEESMDRLASCLDNINTSKETPLVLPPEPPAPPIPPVSPIPTPPALLVAPAAPLAVDPLFPYGQSGAQGNNPFVPPMTSNLSANIEASIIQSVVKLELWPQQIYKLIAPLNNKSIIPTSLFYTAE